MDDSIRLTRNTPAKKAAPGYLEGQLLIATPSVQGEVFSQAVIYVFAHTGIGAMGIILNKPLEMVHYGDIFGQLNIETNGRIDDLAVIHGGPVEENRGFLIHSDDYRSEATIGQVNGVAVTATVNILRDIARGAGPRQRMLAIGYAGWNPGQLEAEIEANSWITIPATQALIFGADADAMWALAAKSLGVDMGRYSSFVGHA